MLKLIEIRKAYPHNRGIVQVSLTINAEQLYLFVGENGSGKSTTIKLISRVIFHKRKEGNLQNTFKRIIYLPDKRSYPKLLKVKTYLEYYLGKNNSIETWLERYNLPNKTIGSLSKGMLQKLGILQTILNDGDLYLLDEPTHFNVGEDHVGGEGLGQLQGLLAVFGLPHQGEAQALPVHLPANSHPDVLLVVHQQHPVPFHNLPSLQYDKFSPEKQDRGAHF